MTARKARTTLLLVDDDYQVRMLLTMVLDNIGYEVVPAEEGFSALRKLREITPSIILSDLNMPGMSGFEFLSIVRRRFTEVRVIAMSGAYTGKDVPPGVAADDFYQKGNDLDELLNLLQPSSNGEKSIQPSCAGQTTVWIPRQEHDGDGRACVTINCPECLRSFRQFSDAQCSSQQETRCLHCAGNIAFAIVENTQPAYLNFRRSGRQGVVNSR